MAIRCPVQAFASKSPESECRTISGGRCIFPSYGLARCNASGKLADSHSCVNVDFFTVNGLNPSPLKSFFLRLPSFGLNSSASSLSETTLRSSSAVIFNHAPDNFSGTLTHIVLSIHVITAVNLCDSTSRQSRRTKTTGSADCIIHFVNLNDFCTSARRNHHLGYLRAFLHLERFRSEIRKYHAYFATIAFVYRTRRIEYGNAVFKGKPASWTHLSLVSGRKHHHKTSVHKRTGSRIYGKLLYRTNVHPGITGMGISRQFCRLINSLELHLHRRTPPSKRPHLP